MIGIGASADCDGQVLVTDDMLGMFERTPRFVKRYDDLATRIGEAARNYAEEVRDRDLSDRRPDLPARSSLTQAPLLCAPQPLDDAPPASVHHGWGREATGI